MVSRSTWIARHLVVSVDVIEQPAEFPPMRVTFSFDLIGTPAGQNRAACVDPAHASAQTDPCRGGDARELRFGVGRDLPGFPMIWVRCIRALKSDETPGACRITMRRLIINDLRFDSR